MNKHLSHILNEFAPLERQSLMSWLTHSQTGRKMYHNAFLSTLQWKTPKHEELDRRTQIAFSLLNEFGAQFAQKTIYSTLVEEIDLKLKQQVPLQTP